MDVRNILQVHPSNIGWGDRVYFRWHCQGAGPGWLEGGINDRAGLGYLVGGSVGIRMSRLLRDMGFLVSQELDGRGSA